MGFHSLFNGFWEITFHTLFPLDWPRPLVQNAVVIFAFASWSVHELSLMKGYPGRTLQAALSAAMSFYLFGQLPKIWDTFMAWRPDRARRNWSSGWSPGRVEMPHAAFVLFQQLLLATSLLVLLFEMWCPSSGLCRDGAVPSKGQGRATWGVHNWVLWWDQSCQGHALSREWPALLAVTASEGPWLIQSWMLCGMDDQSSWAH